MKKFLAGLLLTTVITMTSCETTREININANGSGTVSSTTDLGGLLGIAKMSGQGEKMEGMDRAIDTSIDLAKMVDSIPELTPTEKGLLSKGKLGLKINMEQDQFIFKVDFPFGKTTEIGQLDKLTGKVMQQATRKQMGGGEDMPSMLPSDSGSSQPEEYFVTTYAAGVIDHKLDKAKYAKVGDNEMLQGMKEMAGMGMGKTTTIINLPSPAKKVEGASLTLSPDKKKVTIVTSLEDFFEDAARMEYHIEY